jgi:hypothetical protein
VIRRAFEYCSSVSLIKLRCAVNFCSLKVEKVCNFNIHLLCRRVLIVTIVGRPYVIRWNPSQQDLINVALINELTRDRRCVLHIVEFSCFDNVD